jgi:type VI secretion system secreted protein Hcp
MSKELCSGSGDLLKEAYSGAGKADAVISFVRTDAGGGVPYLVYTLSNVMLSQHSTAGNSESRPQESFNLNFTKIETKITPQKVDGTAGTASITTYDLAAQKNT